MPDGIMPTVESRDDGRKLVQKPAIRILPQVAHKSLTKMRLRDGDRMMPKLIDASPAKLRGMATAIAQGLQAFSQRSHCEVGGGAAWKQFLMRSDG
jgi:hypothetical protein